MNEQIVAEMNALVKGKCNFEFSDELSDKSCKKIFMKLNRVFINIEQDASDDFLIEFGEHLHWGTVINRKMVSIDKQTIEEQAKTIKHLLMTFSRFITINDIIENVPCNKFSIKAIELIGITNKTDLYFRYNKITKNELKEYEDKLNWENISTHQLLTIGMAKKYKNRLNWKLVCQQPRNAEVLEQLIKGL